MPQSLVFRFLLKKNLKQETKSLKSTYNQHTMFESKSTWGSARLQLDSEQKWAGKDDGSWKSRFKPVYSLGFLFSLISIVTDLLSVFLSLSFEGGLVVTVKGGGGEVNSPVSHYFPVQSK